MIRYAFIKMEVFMNTHKIIFLKINDSRDTMTPSENYLIVLRC